MKDQVSNCKQEQPTYCYTCKMTTTDSKCIAKIVLQTACKHVNGKSLNISYCEGDVQNG